MDQFIYLYIYIYIYMYMYIYVHICTYMYMSTSPVCHCKSCTLLLHICHILSETSDMPDAVGPVSLGHIFGWVWGRPGLDKV